MLFARGQLPKGSSVKKEFSYNLVKGTQTGKKHQEKNKVTSFSTNIFDVLLYLSYFVVVGVQDV